MTEHSPAEPGPDAWIPFPFRASFSAADVEVLRRGHTAQEMEDRWDAVFGADGELMLTNRWMRATIFRLPITVTAEGAGRSDHAFVLASAAEFTRRAEAVLASLVYGLLLHREDDRAVHAIHRAAARGDVEAVRQCLDAGVDVDRFDFIGWTPLVHAALGGHVAVMDVLLSAGADPERSSPGGGHRALHWAAGCGHVEAVDALLVRGAGVDARDGMGLTPLLHACRSTKQEPRTRTVVRLLRAGADPNACAEDGRTPLEEAARWNLADAVGRLVRAGAVIDPPTGGRWSPLMSARPEAARALLRAGAAVRHRAERGWTPMHAAAAGSLTLDLEMLNVVHAAGGRIDERNDAGCTPLHRAGTAAAAAWLVERGADVNARSTDGSTPLHTACETAHAWEVIEWLVGHGADLRARRGDGSTPLDSAVSRMPKHVDGLRRLGAKTGAELRPWWWFW